MIDPNELRIGSLVTLSDDFLRTSRGRYEIELKGKQLSVTRIIKDRLVRVSYEGVSVGFFRISWLDSINNP